jgi:hypothetical protein
MDSARSWCAISGPEKAKESRAAAREAERRAKLRASRDRQLDERARAEDQLMSGFDDSRVPAAAAPPSEANLAGSLARALHADPATSKVLATTTLTGTERTLALVEYSAWTNAGGVPCALVLLKKAGASLSILGRAEVRNCAEFAAFPVSSVAGDPVIAVLAKHFGKYQSETRELLAYRVSGHSLVAAFRERIYENPGSFDDQELATTSCTVSSSDALTVSLRCSYTGRGQKPTVRTFRWNGTVFAP